MSDWPQKFLHAFSERHHYDSVSAAHEELTLADAYDIQHQFVALRKEPVAGFKAALTDPNAQQIMGLEEPIMGVLFADGEFSDLDPVVPNKQALLEAEVGFVCAQTIEREVTPDSVLELMSACLPMIEVASPNLATKPNGLDLVATNSASYGYIKGITSAPDTPLDDLPIVLKKGDETLLQGTAGEVMGGQRQALAWLVNQTLARGYGIDAGHLFMTGSIGGMCPAIPGDYRAEFANLGNIAFTIGQS